jgi:hypothetical protein
VDWRTILGAEVGCRVGEVAWHDFQVLLNSYNRRKKILKLPVPDETAAQAATRLSLRREYKEALQIHEQYIRDEAELRVSELETEIVAAAIAKCGEAHVQTLRRQSTHMRQYLGGLSPTNDFAVNTIEEVEPEGVSYAQMDADSRRSLQ